MPTNVINGNQANVAIYDFSEEDEVLLSELEAEDTDDVEDDIETAQGDVITTDAGEPVTTMTREVFDFTHFNSMSDFSEAYDYASDYYDRNCDIVRDMIKKSIKENNFVRTRIFKSIKSYFVETNQTSIVDNKLSNIKINKIVKDQVVEFLNLDIKKFFLFEKMHFWHKNYNVSKKIKPDIEFLQSLKKKCSINNFIDVDFKDIDLTIKEFSISNDNIKIENSENISIEKKYNVNNTLDQNDNRNTYFSNYDFKTSSQERINEIKNKEMTTISNFFDMLFVDPKSMSTKEYKLKDDHYNILRHNDTTIIINNNVNVRNVKLMNSVNYGFIYNDETSDKYKTKTLDSNFDHFSFFKETNDDLDIYIQNLKKEISERFEIPEVLLEKITGDTTVKSWNEIYEIITIQALNVIKSLSLKFENYVLINKDNIKNVKVKREYILSKIQTLQNFINKLYENRDVHISDFNPDFLHSEFKKYFNKNLFGLIYNLKDKSYRNLLINSINSNSSGISDYEFKDNFIEKQPFCNFKYGKMINHKTIYSSDLINVYFPSFSEFKIRNKDYFDFKLHIVSYNKKSEKTKNNNFTIVNKCKINRSGNYYSNNFKLDIASYFSNYSDYSNYEMSDFIISNDYIEDYIKYSLLDQSNFEYYNMFAFMAYKDEYFKYLKFQNFKYVKQEYEKTNLSNEHNDVVDEYKSKSQTALNLEKLLIYFTTNQGLLINNINYVNNTFEIRNHNMIVFKDNKMITDLIFKYFISKDIFFPYADEDSFFEKVSLKYEKALKTISPIIFADSIIERCSTNIKKYYPILDKTSLEFEFGNTESDFERAATAIYSKSNGNYSSIMIKSQSNSCMRYLKCKSDDDNSVNKKLELSKGTSTTFFTNAKYRGYGESYYGNCKSNDYVSILKQESHAKHPTVFYANGDFMSLAIKSKTLKDVNDNDIYYMRSVVGVYDTRKMYSIPDYYDLEKNIICHKEVSFLDFYKYHYEKIIGDNANQDQIYNDILENDYIFVFGPFYISDFNVLNFVKDYIIDLTKDTSENNKFKDKKISIYGIYNEPKLEIKEFPIGWTGLKTNKLSNLVFKYSNKNEFFIFKPYVDLESILKYNEDTDSFIFTKVNRRGHDNNKDIISELINNYINIKNDDSFKKSKIYSYVNKNPYDFYYIIKEQSFIKYLSNKDNFKMSNTFYFSENISNAYHHIYESILLEPNGFSEENVLKFKRNNVFSSRVNGTSGWYRIDGCEEIITLDLTYGHSNWTVGALEKDPCWFVNQNPDDDMEDEQIKIEEA